LGYPIGEWIGEDRLTSKRRSISAGIRKDIADELKEMLEDTLLIYVESMKDYFQQCKLNQYQSKTPNQIKPTNGI
jgi:hypothetical protein